jgi:cystathionine beta-lyase/cystathionine gamma-synthase
MPTRKLATLAVHAGQHQADASGWLPTSVPVYHSVAYSYPKMAELDAVFEGTGKGYVYGRYGNPTVESLEAALAALEGAGAALAYGSGMAAVHGALLGAGVSSTRGVVCARDVYGATRGLLDGIFAPAGVDSVYVNVQNHEEVREALAIGSPAALVCEAISNPLLRVADIAALADLSHRAGAALIVDSTFATPWLVRPLELGADYAVASATKYLAGHGDALAGIVACSEDRAQGLEAARRLMGPSLAPQEAWKVRRGLVTLALRMREHCANAQRVADWLATQRGVEAVHYPGLPAHPEHALAARQFEGRGFGGAVAFELANADRADAFHFLDALELIRPAPSLGDTMSLALHPASSSHRAMAPKERHRLGITEGLIRISVGIEDAEDIIEDLAQALSVVS